ncbi:MAG: MBL fold metallo-hydrolase, partial [Bacteroidota bacterium]
MSLMINVLPASNGDSIIIKYGDDKDNFKYILIDGGRGFLCFNMLKDFFKEREEENCDIELVIITHIDDDHINGILKLAQDPSVNIKIIKDIWFNSGKTLANFFKPGTQDCIKEIPLVLTNETEMSFKQGNTLERYLEDLGIW